jgi:hypothetical protein
VQTRDYAMILSERFTNGPRIRRPPAASVMRGARDRDVYRRVTVGGGANRMASASRIIVML